MLSAKIIQYLCKVKRPLGHSDFYAKIHQALSNERLGQSLLIDSYKHGDHFRVALELALKFNCESLDEHLNPCYECSKCQSILSLSSPDFLIVFPAPSSERKKEEKLFALLRSAFSEFPYMSLQDWNDRVGSGRKQAIIPVEEIRKLRQKLVYQNFVLPKRVVLIWYAEKMNIQAANALLKSLEEPSENTYFILTTENYSSLLPTITSRCQRLLLKPHPTELLKNYLMETASLPESKAEVLAHLAEGSLSQAVRMLKEASEEGLFESFRRLLGLVYKGKVKELNLFASDFAHSDKEYQKYFANYLLRKFRDALLLKIEAQEATRILPQEKKAVEYLANVMSREKLISAIEKLDSGIRDIERNVNVQFWLLEYSMWLHQQWKRKEK